jgi:sugar/nucleoside kinase (ribokinase family)
MTFTTARRTIRAVRPRNPLSRRVYESPRSGPAVVAVGAASRDLDPSDPRGWRLGGSVVYLGFALATLGVRAGLLVGVDAEAAAASELAALEALGVSVVRVPLSHGPVFDLVETPAGRRPRWLSLSDQLPPSALPPAWSEVADGVAAPAFVLAPVAGELGPEWASVPPADSLVALGWQGLLRDFAPGGEVRPLAPAPGPLTRRADLVVVSAEDLGGAASLSLLAGCLSEEASVFLTLGERGGLALVGGHLTRYPALTPERVVDATGAGDSFLAGLVAGALAGEAAGPATEVAQRHLLRGQLLLGAALASLVVEGRGLSPFADPAAARARLRERLRTMLSSRPG